MCTPEKMRQVRTFSGHFFGSQKVFEFCGALRVSLIFVRYSMLQGRLRHLSERGDSRRCSAHLSDAEHTPAAVV